LFEAPSNYEVHETIEACLAAASDADGWLFFQLQLFPNMETPEDRQAMLVLEDEFLVARGLSVELQDGLVSLMKDGDSIAGCTLEFHTSPRVLTESNGI